jgi:periplasmic protein TonB
VIFLDETPPRALALPEWLQTEFGRRATGLAVALALELLLLLALLSLSQSVTPPVQPLLTEVDLSAQDVSEPAPEQPQPEEEQPRPDAPTTPTEIAPTLQPAPPPAVVIPLTTAPTVPAPVETPSPARPEVRLGPVQGPPNRASSASSDSERVGTAPNGEPLYAARWYREPGEEFRGFLSAASPGWGLMACRTVPNYYVTDCVPLGETPGSMLSRSMLAGSGQLRVRPPQLGGRLLVGSWVRIRIDYTVRRE